MRSHSKENTNLYILYQYCLLFLQRCKKGSYKAAWVPSQREVGLGLVDSPSPQHMGWEGIFICVRTGRNSCIISGSDSASSQWMLSWLKWCSRQLHSRATGNALEVVSLLLLCNDTSFCKLHLYDTAHTGFRFLEMMFEKEWMPLAHQISRWCSQKQQLKRIIQCWRNSPAMQTFLYAYQGE